MSAQKQKPLHHEDITIDALSRPKVIRPERLKFSDPKCHLEIDGTKYNVINISLFGICIESDHDIPALPFQNKETGSLSYDGFPLNKYLLRKLRTTKHNDKWHTTFEVTEKPFSISQIQILMSTLSEVKKHQDSTSYMLDVPKAFRRMVFEMKNWLNRLENHITIIEGDCLSKQLELIDVEETVASVVTKYMRTFFQLTYCELSKSIEELNDQATLNCFEFFRETLGSLIYQAPFAHRTYHKPLGYAGDYEMMNIIYKNETIGNTLFAKCLHRYFVEEPASEAVRNRSHYLLKKIEAAMEKKAPGETLKILSVACGPAEEIQLLLKKNPPQKDIHIEFTFVDQDLSALNFAQKQLRILTLKHSADYSFKFINLAIKNLIVRGYEDKDFDLIYSAGLYDYLSAPVATMASKSLFKSLVPGGQLIVGNYSISNPNQFTMNLALDWHLIYRTAEAFKEIFTPLGESIQIEQESLGINLFAIINKAQDNELQKPS